MDMLTDLHFLRPLWPLAVLPVLALLAWSASRPKHGDGGWSGVIDEKLLQPLLVGRLAESRVMRRLLAALALVLAAVALAGPAWKQLPQPVMQNSRGLVLLLDLSPSMVIDDVAPSRLEVAKFKLRDVLAEFDDRPTGLIAFAGSAHVVAPISSDGKTVANLLRTLHPEIMPKPGSRIAPALLRANELLRDGGSLRGDVLLITDSESRTTDLKAAEKLASEGHRLTVLGVGTAEGSPIPDGEGGFLRDRLGRIVVAKLANESLRQLALAGSGVYRSIADEQSLSLLNSQSGEWLNNQTEDSPLQSEGWQDEGAWFLLPILLLVAVGARKGMLFSLIPAAAIGLASLQSTSAFAQTPDAAEPESYSENILAPLFQTGDQRGQQALQAENPEKAAELFNDPAWKATALYRAGDYEEAAAAFAGIPGAASNYNQGNALAKSGNLEAAAEAYERALQTQPGHADASANLELVKKLLEQQQQEQQQDQQNGDEGNPDDQQQQDQGENQDGEQGDEQNQQDQQQGDEPQSSEQDSQPSQSGEPESGEQDSEPQSASQSDEQKDSDEESSETAADEEQADESGKENEQQLADEKAAEQAEEEAKQRAQAEQQKSQQPLDEQQQALQQWLNRIPDDPGGLLRRKFARQQQRQQQMGQQVEADGEAGW